jgi:hypothetical protein
MQYTGVTEAQKFFETGASLPPGEAVVKMCATAGEANSFRVGLYKVRKRLEDYSVTISIDGLRVTATKNGDNGAVFEHLDRNGNRVGDVVIETAQSRGERLIAEEEKEILQQAKINGWNKTATDDLLAAARFSILDRIRRGVL